MQKINKALMIWSIASTVAAVVATSKLFSPSAPPAGAASPAAQVEPAGAAAAPAGAVASALPAAPAAQAAPAEPATPVTVYREMKIREFNYDGDKTVTLTLSEKPDLAVVREYVKVEPVGMGEYAFGLTTRTSWRNGEKIVEPALWITGDYPHRTNITLRVKKGFPMAARATAPGPGVEIVDEPLAEEYVHKFVRRDRSPRIGFADKGRYLPPAGRRAIAVSSVNVSNIVATVSAVPAGNIVQMLALEEGVYDDIYSSAGWSDSESFINDISSERWTENIAMPNRLNEEERATLVLRPPNGAYLVALDAKEASSRYRLVCVTDLGISARRTRDGYLVWVTSLAGGVPVAGAIVDVYTTANDLAGRAVTGQDGLARVKCADVGGKPPFAVIASAPGGDTSFVALRDKMQVSESYAGFEDYVAAGELTAFAWTERGIYRHDEPVMFHALVRDGSGTAPRPLPLELVVTDPADETYLRRALMTDALGAVACEDIAIPADRPSGIWTFKIRTPGRDGVTIGRRDIKVEEFAPPQIRVKAHAAAAVHPRDFSLTVSAEHLYGGPAADLVCEGAVVFEDAPFAPEGWNGWRFGDASRALVPNFRVLAKEKLDANGKCVIAAPMWADHGKPAAAVRATAQGTVFEDGGRPATARDSAMLHYYPYYIGTTLTEWVRLPETGHATISVACVAPDGRRLAESKQLKARLERIDTFYSCKTDDETGRTTWKCDRVKTVVADDISVEVPSGGDAGLEILALDCGDYTLTLADAAADVSFGMDFYLASWGDASVRAPLSNPSAVALTLDKKFYRPGERPRIRVRSPFAGTALMTVMRDDVVYSEVLTLTNATCEVELRPVEPGWAPNVNVSLSVLQGVAANSRRLAFKAHGEATVPVRRAENEIAVAASASFSGREVAVELSAPGATEAVVTLVDEGINMLTGEPAPDPVGHFSRARLSPGLAAYDLYRRILPVAGEGELMANGAKTGGGFGAEMLDRVSPVATRRFKPLAMWQRVAIVDGRARLTFALPEFAGEVRVAAVAYSANAAGAAAVQCKAAPKLVAQPDAPRFVAPGDEFEATLPLANRAGVAGVAQYEIACGGKTVAEGSVDLAKNETKLLRCTVKAPASPGELAIRYRSKGFGETHETELFIPVRPAVAWAETSGVEVLEPGENFAMPAVAHGEKFRYHVSTTPMAGLRNALEWLSDYPHGCLEQTASRIFPLIAAGGILTAFDSAEAANRAEYVVAGVRRVESMVRKSDFVMWPDCSYAPWDVEVSLYAAHFLVEAERAGATLDAAARDRVMGFLGRWAMSPTNSVSAYACHSLALAGRPERDRMYRLYDARARLDLLSRARLARAFVAIGDRRRATELLKNATSPESVKEASFMLLAILELDPADSRAARLVNYLTFACDKDSMTWGTTGDNAHALLALGEYLRRHPVKPGAPKVAEAGGTLVNAGDGTAFVVWKRLALPRADEVADESQGLAIRREYLTAAGEPYDIAAAKCGDLVMVRLSIACDTTRDLSDLVIEDLYPAAMEPVHGAIDPALYPWVPQGADAWVMRADARDDRLLVFSKKFHLEKGDEAKFHYPLRVVSAGTFTVPKVAVEAMYSPGLRARSGGGRIVVRH